MNGARVNGFKGSTNRTVYEVSKNGEPFDLQAAGIIRIEVVESSEVLSTDDGSVTFNGATFAVEWGAFNLPRGSYIPTIYAYRSGDSKGEVLSGPKKSPFFLRMIEDERPT